MDISKYFTHLKLTDDQNNAISEVESFLAREDDVFILRGYAGSGKTTLLKGLVNYLNDQNINFRLMAPTGRATKVLQSKTRHGATTIHKGIYCFEKLLIENDESNEDFRIKYIFPLLVDNDSSKILTSTVVIIDEASMISNSKANHELFSFGSDILLQDLLTHVFKGRDNKIIFVGDPAQLPPVTDNKSYALDKDYFIEKGFKAEMYEMTEVVRQTKDSSILTFANSIRELLHRDVKERNNLVLQPNNIDVFLRNSSTLIDEYVEQNPSLSFNNSAVICYSNATAHSYNEAIRNRFGFNNDILNPGELLMITQNNYSNPDVELFNGDIIKVISISQTPEIFNVPVYIKVNGVQNKIHVELIFRELVFAHESGEEFKMKIIENMLYNNHTGLTLEEVKALYINFKMQNPDVKDKSPDLKLRIKSDPYFNALRVKFAYAITCHKAQGGEWEKVMIDYSGRIGLNNDCLRWIYTATTRSKQLIYGSSIPNLTPLRKMSFSPIGKISKPSSDALIFTDVAETPWHTELSMPCKRKKYYDLENLLSVTPYKINRVKSNPYLEEYYIDAGEHQYRFDVMHDGAGFFKKFTTKTTDPVALELLNLFNDTDNMDYQYTYEPSGESFNQLYQHVSACLFNTETKITNIVESVSSYYITYYFKTSGLFSYIQFYFDATKTITKAMPKSDLGDQDNQLQLLIKKLI